MNLSKPILQDIRMGLGLSEAPSPFDTDLLMHINTAVGKLNQNGIGIPVVVTAETTWAEFRDPTQIVGNALFHMVPLFVLLSTKIIFDPPPPSSVEYHANNANEILWRLKLAYE
jgi:hypothetical protein